MIMVKVRLHLAIPSLIKLVLALPAQIDDCASEVRDGEGQDEEVGKAEVDIERIKELQLHGFVESSHGEGDQGQDAAAHVLKWEGEGERGQAEPFNAVGLVPEAHLQENAVEVSGHLPIAANHDPVDDPAVLKRIVELAPLFRWKTYCWVEGKDEEGDGDGNQIEDKDVALHRLDSSEVIDDFDKDEKF